MKPSVRRLALVLSLPFAGPALAVPQGSAPPLPVGVPGGVAAYNDARLKAIAPQYLSYTAFGTSLTAGCCASTPAKTFVSLVGAQLGVVPVNDGISGAEMADMQPGIYAQAVGDTASQLFTLDVGKNEGAFYGTAANRVATFQALHQASLAWLATPARNKVVGQSATAPASVSSVAFAGAGSNPNYGTATVTTAAAHGFTTGQAVTIAGASPSSYNVTGPVAVVDATHFTIPVAGTPSPASPATGTITATGPGIAYAGTWNADSAYGGALSMHSATNGSTATFVGYGATIHLAYGMASGNGGTASVTVDGNAYATLTTNGVSGGFATTNQSVTRGSGLLRITGLSAAQHTVVVTVTSSTASGNDVWVDWVSGKGSPGASAYPAGPTVVAMGSPQGGNGSYADAAYVTASSQDVGVLAGDGLDVVYADVPGNINPGTDIQPDNVHFNDLGEVHAAEAVMAALNTASTARGKSAILAGQSNPFLGPVLSGAAYGNTIATSGPGGNAILGGGYGGANFMGGSGNNNAVVCGTSNHIGGGGTGNTNSNFLGCGSQNTVQYGGSNFLGSGSLNTVQGFYNVLGGGQANQVYGTYSGILGGGYAADRSRYGWQGFGSGSFTSQAGTAQAGAQVLRGTGSTAAAIRLTADGAAAGGANVMNLPAGGAGAYGLRITLQAFDVTAPANTYLWSAPVAVLFKTGAAQSTTALTLGTPVTLATNSWAPTVSAAADTTNGGINLSLTPPSGNTDTIHVVARVDSLEVQ